MGTMDLDALVARCRENLRAGKDPKDGLTPSEVTALMTRYSKFADQLDADGMLVSSEVVVHALRPPRPFVHMMASGHSNLRGVWGSFWDQTRGGFCCLDSVMAGKMSSHLDTNYVPTCPEPQDVRNFWVHQKGKAWPMFPVAGHEDNSYHGYRVRMGLDRIGFTVKRGGLRCELTMHVPAEHAAEAWQVTITNESPQPQTFSWFSNLRVDVNSFPFYYFVPRVVCEGVLEDGAMVFLNHDQSNKHPRSAYFLSEPQFDGYDMMSEVFDGWSPRATVPAAVARGACFNSPGLQPAAGLVAAAQYNATLAPNESKTWTLVYGACSPNTPERKEAIAAVRRDVLAKPAESLAAVGKLWQEKVLCDAIDTPDKTLNRYFNVWSKYQSRNQTRFCAALDKLGYRDVLQHLLGIIDFDPAYTRARILEALRYQFADGRAVRQYEVFPGAGHDMRMYQDAPVWIPDTLVKYLKETGDVSILEEVVPFLDAQTNQPSTTESGTVYEHAARGLRSVYGNTGYHDLCKIGYGDWNDALSRIGGEKGVSIWLSCACVYACKLMAEVAELASKDDDARQFRAVADALTTRINEHAWDGQWYIYAINFEGKPIGSHTQTEGSLHLNVNTWALFSGVAAAGGREEQTWQAVEKLARPIGHLLLDPPYTHASGKDVGRIADCMPGQFENGSMYTHGEAFYWFALVQAGRSDKWFAEVPKTVSSYLVPDISTGPPHQQSNYAVGPAHPSYGMNLFSNFTGSIGWYRRSVETVCGLVPEFAGLKVAPRPPKAWKQYRVTRNFRGCRIQAKFLRGRKFALKLNGQDVPTDGKAAWIPAAQLPKGGTVTLEVTFV